MDTLRGNFDPSDSSEDVTDYDIGEEENARDLPPAAIGQDERRMQVRAYNHWASDLGDRNFPAIGDLDPESIDDFGPYSVLLDFSQGIEDPAVQFLGSEIAEECGADDSISKLSDVPSRSLLTRITDHYMQILANQAPIGFEAEFVNQRGLTILYRGILLPYSSDDETIDFIYGVINWKQMADQATADELLLEIDQALEPEEEDEPQKHKVGPVTDWADGPAAEAQENDIASIEPAFDDNDEDDSADDLPLPDFGQFALSEEEEEEEDEANYDFASLTDHVSIPEKKAQAIDLDGLEPFVEQDSGDADVNYGDAASESLGEDSGDNAGDNAEVWQSPDTNVGFDATSFDSNLEAQPDTQPADEPDASDGAARSLLGAEVVDTETGDTEPGDTDIADDAGLYDYLASARELAQNARSSEDRSRNALYAAVGRAYDFSIAAEAEPEEYDELVAESGLTVQDRAPMTPIVKLVFGVDYDKTRLTEYAAVLGHAHRVGIERGALASFLSEAEGGLKGVVAMERRLRREESGKPVQQVDSPREALAKKLRAIAPLGFDDIDNDGEEFALVMIRRTEDGEVVVLGEIDNDVPLIERAARKLVA
ncbi:MAG: hypothetical protein ABJ239_05420 [Erythrobacter sp.]